MNKSQKENMSSLKRLLSSMGARRLLLFAAILLATLSTALGMVPYFIVGLMAEKILNAGAGKLSELSFVFYGFGALGAVLAKGILFALSTKLSHLAAFPVLYDIRIMLAEKLTRLPLGFFQLHEPAKIKSMMNEQVDALEHGIAHFLPSMTASTAVPFLALIFMFSADWRLALAVLLYAAVLYFIFKVVVKKVMGLVPQMQKVRIALQSTLLHYIYGMKVIKAFARSEESYDRFRSELKSLAAQTEQIDSRMLGHKSIANGLSRLSLIFLVPTGIFLYAQGTLALPVFIFFLLMAMSFGKTFFNFIHGGSHILGSVRLCMDNVDSFMAQPILKEPEVPKAPHHTGIDFNKVSFSYGNGKKALHEVSFSAKPGTMTAIVGPSGSGKSTVIRLLSRFWDVEGGSVSVGGTDVRDIASGDLARHVSCVFQEVFLFNDTLFENIRLGKPDATLEEIVAAAQKARCHDFITALPQGYNTRIGEHGSTLSGGQRQRISLARALLKDSPVLLLDEATAFVDAENEAAIGEVLKGLLKPENGRPKTLILVAHRLSTIRHADKILVLDQGKLEALGTHEDLLAISPLYTGMWKAFQRSEDGLTLRRRSTVPEEGKTSLNPKRVATSPDHQKDEGKEERESFHFLTKDTSYLKKLLSLAGKDRAKLLKACVYPILMAVLFSTSALCLVRILSSLLSGHIPSAWAYAGALLSSQLLLLLLERLCQQSFCRYDNTVAGRLRLFLGRHLRRLPMSFFYGRDGATLQARLTTDVTSLALNDSLANLIRGTLTPFLLFFALLKLNWALALISLAGLPLYLWMTSSINRALKETEQQQKEAGAKVSSKTLEFIQGIPVIRAFALPDMRLSGYRKAIKDHMDADMSALNRYIPYEAWYGALYETGFSAVLFFAGILLNTGRMDGFTLLMFMILLLGALEPLPLLGYVTARRKFLTACDHLGEILDSPALSEPDSKEEKAPKGYDVAINSVSFSYRKANGAFKGKASEKTLQNISLTVPERTMVALAGPSGGGKTTLLHLIARFWDADEGSILIGGADIRQMRLDTLMKHISIVFQDVYLFRDTIFNNIRFGKPDASAEEVVAAAKAARCHDFIEKLPEKYETIVSDGGASLSGGEKQRLSIARAILKDSPIILLDEATSSVDPENEWEIQEALMALAADKTLIVVAHRLNTIRHADRIVVLDNGQIAEAGTHEQLLHGNGLYTRLWAQSSNCNGDAFLGTL